MIRPPDLKKGDKIAIVSPARSITFEEVHPAIRFFQRYGLEVVLGNHVFSKHNQFAGKDQQRCRDLQKMLDDDAIRAIICARGGYGTVRVIDSLDFKRFCEHPKWIVGYSDITVLHAHIQQRLGIETLHAVMPVNIKEGTRSETLQSMVNALFGKRINYTYPGSPYSRSGKAEGELIGGNLSVLFSLMGSPSEPDTAGKILFLEDLDEYLYHIDRMMMTLKRAGKLKALKGLIVGEMSDMHDNPVPYGMTANAIIADAINEYSYPVCFDFPAGHTDPNLALIMGRRATLTVGSEVELSFY